jgi:hypothetical protein
MRKILLQGAIPRGLQIDDEFQSFVVTIDELRLAKYLPRAARNKSRSVHIGPFAVEVVRQGLPESKGTPFVSMSEPNYHCPVCGQQSELILNPEQAFCTNTAGCKVIVFNPSLPDRGLSQVHEIKWPEEPGER